MADSQTNTPQHVAVIMDGNGRWARKRRLPRVAGHRAGVGALRKLVASCSERGVQVLTVFAFSSENWRRPPAEVRLLLELFLATVRGEVRAMNETNIRLRIIGDRSAFPAKLREAISRAEARTAGNTGLTLVIAANYGGRWDMAQAAQQAAEAVRQGLIQPEDITPEYLEQSLALSDLPEPDLFIRSGGEQRISNFLLWQLAYTELYFTDTLWPDFDAGEFELALESYACRQRRFGMTGDQVTDAALASTG